MISIDTNILLRRLLEDDAAQARKVRKLFDSNESILVTDVVLVETIWTLKGKRYGAYRETIIAVVSSLLEEPNIMFESEQAIWSALNDFSNAAPVKTSNGTKSADFSDALIVNKSKIVAQELGLNFEATYTFDQAALEIDGTASIR